MLSELILETRQRADMVNSAFVTDLEVTRCINESWAQLYDALLSTGEDYYLKYVDLPAANTFGPSSVAFAYHSTNTRASNLGFNAAVAAVYDVGSARVFTRITNTGTLAYWSPSTGQAGDFVLTGASDSTYIAAQGPYLYVTNANLSGNFSQINPVIPADAQLSTIPNKAFTPDAGVWHDVTTGYFVAATSTEICKFLISNMTVTAVAENNVVFIAQKPGKLFYIKSATAGQVFVFDVASGASSLLCTLPEAAYTAVYEAVNDRIFAVCPVFGVYAINATTGAFQSLAAPIAAVPGMSFGGGGTPCYDAASGSVLVGSTLCNLIVAINPATLAVTLAFSIPVGQITTGLVSAAGYVVALVSGPPPGLLAPAMVAYSVASAVTGVLPSVFDFPNYTSSTGGKATDVYQVRGVDASRSGDFTVNVPRYNWEERNVMSSGLLTPASGLSAAYRVTQNPTSGLDSLTLIPATGTGFTGFRVWYYPNPKELVLSSDFIDGRSGWEEWVVVDAAIKLLAKEESDTSALEREAGRVWARVTAVAVNRDAGQSKRITDVSLNNGSWPMDGMYRNRR